MANKQEKLHYAFPFRKEYLDIIKTLDDENKLELFDAICCFGIYENDTVLSDPTMQTIAELIKSDIYLDGWDGMNYK